MDNKNNLSEKARLLILLYEEKDITYKDAVKLAYFSNKIKIKQLKDLDRELKEYLKK